MSSAASAKRFLVALCCWCVLLVIAVNVGVVDSRVQLTEEEKQSAFEQLLSKGARLRKMSAQQGLEPPPSTTTLPPTISSSAVPIMLSDEEAKGHDRRHAGQQKKHNKKDHSKRQHHAGYFFSTSSRSRETSQFL